MATPSSSLNSSKQIGQLACWVDVDDDADIEGVDIPARLQKEIVKKSRNGDKNGI